MPKKTKKLLDRLSELTEDGGAKRETELEGMKALLDKLKKRQKKLEGELENASGGKERRLKRLIKVIKAQRKKGRARYKELRGDDS
jgi:septal ring factor EnvC (AmiA/AmiB activator)